jgi:hypothetical protein
VNTRDSNQRNHYLNIHELQNIKSASNDRFAKQGLVHTIQSTNRNKSLYQISTFNPLPLMSIESKKRNQHPDDEEESDTNKKICLESELELELDIDLVEKKRHNDWKNGLPILFSKLEVQKQRRWHYFDSCMETCPGEVLKLSPNQRAFMDKHQLWRDEFPKWIQDTMFVMHQLPVDIQEILHLDTLYSGCKQIRGWYIKGKPIDKDVFVAYTYKYTGFQITVHLSTLLKYDNAWKHPLIPRLFNDAVVFEGKSTTIWDDNNEELLALKNNTLKKGDVIHRLRPTSTSWNLDAALNFSSEHLFVHHIVDTELLVLLSQYFSSKNLDQSSAYWECEITLQPNINIKIDKITVDSIETYSTGRRAMLSKDATLITVIHTSVTRALKCE